MEQLDISIRNEIDALLKQAKQEIASGNGAGGISTAETAWAKLPAPKFGWDVSKSFTQPLRGSTAIPATSSMRSG
jgi:hypothetical protein